MIIRIGTMPVWSCLLDSNILSRVDAANVHQDASIIIEKGRYPINRIHTSVTINLVKTYGSGTHEIVFFRPRFQTVLSRGFVVGLSV